MSMLTQPSLDPSDLLVTPDIDPKLLEFAQSTNSTQKLKDRSFVLFTNSWMELQSHAARAKLLPVDEKAFTDTYGAFPAAHRTSITSVTSAYSDLRKLSARFGDPATLRGRILQNVDALSGETPPSDIYSHVVWLGTRITRTANDFRDGLDVLQDELRKPNDPDSLREVMTELFTSDYGLIGAAAKQAKLARELIAKIETFKGGIQEIEQVFKDYNAKHALPLVAEAEKIAQDFGTEIQSYKDEMASAKRWKWIGVAGMALAAIVGIGVIFFTGGLAAPVILTMMSAGSGIFGYTRENAERKMAEKVKEATEKQKKAAKLVVDLKDFNLDAAETSRKLADFIANLHKVAATWDTMQSKLSHIHATYDPRSRPLGSNADEATRMAQAARQWRTLGSTAETFTQSSLMAIEYNQI